MKGQTERIQAQMDGLAPICDKMERKEALSEHQIQEQFAFYVENYKRYERYMEKIKQMQECVYQFSERMTQQVQQEYEASYTSEVYLKQLFARCGKDIVAFHKAVMADAGVFDFIAHYSTCLAQVSQKMRKEQRLFYSSVSWKHKTVDGGKSLPSQPMAGDMYSTQMPDVSFDRMETLLPSGFFQSVLREWDKEGFLYRTINSIATVFQSSVIAREKRAQKQAVDKAQKKYEIYVQQLLQKQMCQMEQYVSEGFEQISGGTVLQTQARIFALEWCKGQMQMFSEQTKRYPVYEGADMFAFVQLEEAAGFDIRNGYTLQETAEAFDRIYLEQFEQQERIALEQWQQKVFAQWNGRERVVLQPQATYPSFAQDPKLCALFPAGSEICFDGIAPYVQPLYEQRRKNLQQQYAQTIEHIRSQWQERICREVQQVIREEEEPICRQLLTLWEQDTVRTLSGMTKEDAGLQPYTFQQWAKQVMGMLPEKMQVYLEELQSAARGRVVLLHQRKEPRVLRNFDGSDVTEYYDNCYKKCLQQYGKEIRKQQRMWQKMWREKNASIKR